MPETQAEHGTPTLEIRPDQVFSGQRIVARGSGWRESPIDLFFDEAPFTPARVLEGTLQNGELRPDARGNFVVFLRIPGEVKSGRHQVRAVERERQGEVEVEVVLTEVEPQALVFATEGRIPIDKPGERNRQFILERFGTEVPSLPIARLLIREEVDRIRRARESAGSELGPAIAPVLPGCNWTPIGASVVPNGQLIDPSGTATAPVSGRVTAIAIDPNDPNNTIYVGAAQGGVWKSTDGGATWFSKTDFQASLAIGTITIDASVTDASTGRSNRIYVGTGEENFSLDAYYGAGVLRSDDGGETWTQLAAGTFQHDKISCIIIDPSDNIHLYLACDAGVFESTDTGATWTPLRAGIATDLALDASDTANKRLYAAFKGEGIFLRIGTGSFTQLTSPNLPNPAPGRIALALFAGSPQTIFAAFAKADNPGTLQNIYRTTDAGTTWNALPSVPPSVKNVWYNLVLAVHPTDANTLYFGEVHLWRSTDAGASWTDISVISGSSQGVHADQHTFAFHPSTPTAVWAGNDGGVWLSTDGGTSWSHRNRGLQTLQYYTIAQHPRWEAVILAGAQDNGAQRFSGHPAMLLSAPGDGGYTAIDPTTPSRWYEGRFSQQNSGIFGVFRSDQAGNPGSWNQKTSSINVADRVLFYAPFAIDLSNPSTLYFGTHRLYQTINNADSWNAITGDLTGGGPNQAISAITVASATIVYAGTSDGHFSRVEQSGGTWTATDHSAGLPGQYISDIAVDPTNANTVYVTISRVFTGDHVWRSTDGGATWTSASAGLAALNPVNCIDIDPTTTNRVFIGCDVGLFRSEDQGGTWVEWDQGLPNVAVFDIRVHNSSRLLRAATHGRGIWERPIDASDCPAVDIYLRDDIVDIARTIPTPANVQDPFTSLTTSWDQSQDIKVDTPDSATNQFHTATSTIDYIDFQGLDQFKPRAGTTSRLYVQVHNRGVNVAGTVQVRPFWVDTTTSLPNLPSDFWTAFPNSDPGDISVWHPIGTALSITNLRPGEPQVVEWDWPVPSNAPNQVGVLAAITSTDDPIAETGLDVSTVVPGNKRITLKRMQVDGAALGPTVTGINPTSGPASGGTSVTITGTGFTGATKVSFGSIEATNFTVDSDTQITATSPAANLSGAVDVTVTTPNGTSATSSADQFTYITTGAAPTVTGINPTSGPASGGTTITITGTGFNGATGVAFGSTAASSFTMDSDTQITATSPAANLSGAVDVTVTTPNGTSATSSADQFTYLTATAPTVISINPTSGPASGGTTVTITGSGFNGTTGVSFGSIAASNFTVDSDTQITATSPAANLSGAVDVTVTTPNGTSATSSADQFTYITTGAAPTVTSINPTSGPASGGTSVTITGTGFNGATGVAFGSTAASSFTVDSDTQITATSPAANLSGAVDVTVTTPNGTSATSSADQFTYLTATAPTVTGINPTSGPASGGTSVTITGSGFNGATGVSFGSIAASNFTVDSDTQITATSPAANLSGAVDVTVTTPNGTSATSSSDQFTYITTGAAPTITGISPSSGSAAGGDSVTITGTGFNGATGVAFGSTAASSFTVDSDTQITATSPAANLSGAVDVTVTTPNGTSETSSADQFTYM